MRRLVTLGLSLAVAGAFAVAGPRPAAAQKKKPAAAAKADKAKPVKGKGAKPAAEEGGGGANEPQARIERTAGGGKVIKLTPIVVEGKVQKPLALVLARSSVQYDWEQLKQDFTPKIVEAVSKSPF
jgi:hypothetical protein